ncbi:MAG: hypothetical protein H0U60_02345 [Blastocatellia bacterium]|nr:hypothetical protein [Blastocatellia bacterium]
MGQPHELPGKQGVDHLTHLIHQVIQKLDCLELSLVQHHRRMDTALAAIQISYEVVTERQATQMAQIDEMNTVLQTVADNETKLGTDIQTVVDFLKANPNPTPTDLTTQLAALQGISDKLVATDAATLANLPPAPAGGRR